MTRFVLLVIGVLVLAAAGAGPALALTASECAKIDDPKKKLECLRLVETAGKSGTKPAVPADPSGPGPANPATPAVPGKGKGR